MAEPRPVYGMVYSPVIGTCDQCANGPVEVFAIDNGDASICEPCTCREPGCTLMAVSDGRCVGDQHAALRALFRLEQWTERACQFVYREREGYWPTATERDHIALAILTTTRHENYVGFCLTCDESWPCQLAVLIEEVSGGS